MFLEVTATPPSQLAHAEAADFNAGIAAAQMLGKANFIALIGGGKQPKFPQNKVERSTCDEGIYTDDSSR